MSKADKICNAVIATAGRDALLGIIFAMIGYEIWMRLPATMKSPLPAGPANIVTLIALIFFGVVVVIVDCYRTYLLINGEE